MVSEASRRTTQASPSTSPEPTEAMIVAEFDPIDPDEMAEQSVCVRPELLCKISNVAAAVSVIVGAARFLAYLSWPTATVVA